MIALLVQFAFYSFIQRRITFTPKEQSVFYCYLPLSFSDGLVFVFCFFFFWQMSNGLVLPWKERSEWCKFSYPAGHANCLIFWYMFDVSLPISISTLGRAHFLSLGWEYVYICKWNFSYLNFTCINAWP